MPAAIPALIGGAVSLGGAALTARSANRQTDAMSAAAEQARTQLNPFQYQGPGGMFAGYNGMGVNATTLGDMEGLRTGLVNAGQQGLSGMNQGLPPDLLAALNGSTQASFGPSLDLNGIDTIAGNVSNQFGAQTGNLMNQQANGYQRPFENMSFLGAANQFGIANQNPQQQTQQTLDLLRKQAQPFETRAWDQLQNDQFGSGRMGTTGGGMQTEAFARGLGQADLGRQLAAAQEGRATQQNAAQLGTQFANAGLGVGQLGSNMLQQAFSQWNQTAGLGADLNNQRFQRTLAGNQIGFDRAQSLLGNRMQATTLQEALRSGNLQQVLQSIGGVGGLQQQSLAGFNTGLATQQAAANARIGSGSNVAGILGAQSQMPTSGDIWGQALTGIGSRVAGSSAGSWMDGLFGGGGGSSDLNRNINEWATM